MKIAKTLHEVSKTIVPPAYAYFLEEPLQAIVDLPNFEGGTDIDVLRNVAKFINKLADKLDNA